MIDADLDISEYAHLWDGSDRDWVLYRVRSPRGDVLIPYNTRTAASPAIEDTEVARHVALRMKYAGVPVWTKHHEHE